MELTHWQYMGALGGVIGIGWLVVVPMYRGWKPLNERMSERVRESTTLLSSLNPLRATKYVGSRATAPSTKPTDNYVVTVTTGGTGVTPERTFEIRLRDPGSGQPVVGDYNGLAFEVDRSLIAQLGGDFTWKPAPAAPQTPDEMPDGFPGTLPPPHPAGQGVCR